MTAAELNELREIAHAIKKTKSAITELTAIHGVTYNGCSSHSRASRPTEELAEKISRLNDNIISLNSRRGVLLKKLESQADRLTINQQQVILYRYRDGFIFDDIAVLMGYEVRNIYKLHRIALSAMSKMDT